MSHQKNQDEEIGGVKSVLSAVAMAVVGAGVVAGAIVLKDKKNRDKVKEKLSEVKDKVFEYAEAIKTQVQDKVEVVEKKIAEDKKELNKKLNT